MFVLLLIPFVGVVALFIVIRGWHFQGRGEKW